MTNGKGGNEVILSMDFVWDIENPYFDQLYHVTKFYLYISKIKLLIQVIIVLRGKFS